jgi:hypothetical protein
VFSLLGRIGSFQPSAEQLRLFKCVDPALLLFFHTRPLSTFCEALNKVDSFFPSDSVFDDQMKRAKEICNHLEVEPGLFGVDRTVYLMDGHGRMLWAILKELMNRGVNVDQ